MDPFAQLWVTAHTDTTNQGGMHSPTDTGLLKKQLAEVRKELADKVHV